MNLENKLSEVAEKHNQKVKSLIKDHGDLEVDKVTLSQVYGGLRNVTAMVTETSLLDPNAGIRYRGLSLEEGRNALPKAISGSKEVSSEALFLFLLLGEVPTDQMVKELSDEFKEHGHLPKYAIDALNSLPNNLHPMNYFATLISLMQEESVFTKAYNEGIRKTEYWKYVLKDNIRLIAKLPHLAAHIYAKINNKKPLDSNPKLDLAGNLAHMLGDKDTSDTSQFKEFMRMYLFLHADHEGGNVSANSSHVVGTTLCNSYMLFSAGMQALAGPLHGRACQDVLVWIQNMLKEMNNSNPTKEQVAEFVQKSLDKGLIIPGYGHAVLRITDPRFTLQHSFCKEHNLKSNLIDAVANIYEVTPGVLKAQGKVKNPYPNVDSHSGVILHTLGLQNPEYYTVLFGVSRALGVLAQQVWDKLMMLPIHRPRSVTTEWMENFVKKSK